VEASELSVPAILDGIRRGRVFIDLTASHDKLLDIDAEDPNAPESSNSRAPMGGKFEARSSQTVLFHVRVTACPSCMVHLFLDGKETPELPPIPVSTESESSAFHWTSDGHRHWIRAEVRDAEGHLALISNPVYINDNQR
jgi:hypothetical protein